MKTTIFLVLALALISLYYAADFTASFRMTSSSIAGTLTGTMYYSLGQKRDRYSYVSGGYDVITSYDTAAGGQFFTFRRCSSSQCDTSPNPTALVQPQIEKLSSDTSGTATTVNGVSCTRYSRAASTGLQNICIGSNNVVVQFQLLNNGVTKGEVVTLTNYVASVASGALTANSGWNCIFSCDVPLDIALVVDTSGSIDGNYDPNKNPKYSGEWAQVSSFVQQFTQQFKIEFQKVHMGIVLFGNSQEKVTPTMTYSSSSIASIVAGFRRCTGYPGNGCGDYTRIGNGVLYGVDLLKTNSAARNNVPKIVVLVTDGEDNNGVTFALSLSSSVSSTTSWVNNIDSTASNSWAQFTKVTKSVKLITIGVGGGIDTSYLISLASPSGSTSVGTQGKLYFGATTFFTLSGAAFIQSLGTAICTATSTISPCSSSCAGLCACGSCICPNDCSDGTVCTTDTCSNNVFNSGCRNTPIDCNDNNYCTTDGCNPTTGCTHSDVICNDNNNLCTIDTCITTSGCRFTPKNCTNPDPCLVGSVCQGTSGVCSATTNICNDDNACTEERCTGPNNTPPCSFVPIDCTRGNKCIVPDCNRNAAGNNGCTNQSVTCNDGNLCTTDTCDPAVGCVFTPTNCNDNNECTIDLCDPAVGCINTPINVTETCDRGDLCTNYTCNSTHPGGCYETPLRCDNNYNDGCILVFCDPAQGCAPFPKVCNYSGSLGANVKPECVNGFCDSTAVDPEKNCIFEETDECKLTVIAASTAGAVLGIGAIVGIIIGAVVCVGATTTVAVLGFNGAFSGEFENKNPLYEKETKEGKNPLYENKNK